MKKAKPKTKVLCPDHLEELIWINKNGLKHTKFVEKCHEIPKDIISKLKFEPYKALGHMSGLTDTKVYPRLKAGDVLKLKSRKYVLVGHVNKNLGVCDDCTDFKEEDIKEIASFF
jgi:hypothetical protein